MWIDENTSFIVQGLTGRAASFYTRKWLEQGLVIQGGVSPKNGGEKVAGKPIFSSIQEAKKAFSIDASFVFVPKEQFKYAVEEAVQEEIPWIISFTKDVALSDMLDSKKALKNSKSRMIGPSSSGVIFPGMFSAGLMPTTIYQPGSIGIISRSASLGYEAAFQLKKVGLGVSMRLCLGEDPILGEDFLSALPLLLEDTRTKALLILGEGGDAVDLSICNGIESMQKKPIALYIPRRGKLSPKSTESKGLMYHCYEAISSKITERKNPSFLYIEDMQDIGHKLYLLMQTVKEKAP